MKRYNAVLLVEGTVQEGNDGAMLMLVVDDVVMKGQICWWMDRTESKRIRPGLTETTP